MVASLRDTYGIDYIYCWHGLPAYWSGISVEDPGEFLCACLLGGHAHGARCIAGSGIPRRTSSARAGTVTA